jgi:hypothetical protein
MKIDPERGRLKKKQNQIVGLIKKPLQHLGQNHQSFKITGFSRMKQISEEKINPGTKMNKVLRKARSLEVLAHQPDTTSTGALLPAPFSPSPPPFPQQEETMQWYFVAALLTVLTSSQASTTKPSPPPPPPHPPFFCRFNRTVASRISP